FRYIADLPTSRLKVMLISYAAAKLADKTGREAPLVLGLPPSPSRDSAIAAYAEAWARLDSLRAYDWARALPPGAAQAQALHDVWFIWCHADPIGSAAHLAELPQSD